MQVTKAKVGAPKTWRWSDAAKDPQNRIRRKPCPMKLRALGTRLESASIRLPTDDVQESRVIETGARANATAQVLEVLVN